MHPFAREKYAVGKFVTKVKITTNQMYNYYYTIPHARTHAHTRAPMNTGVHFPLVSGNWLPKVYSIFTDKDS